jgi:PAS domain S-box-containing protein
MADMPQNSPETTLPVPDDRPRTSLRRIVLVLFALLFVLTLAELSVSLLRGRAARAADESERQRHVLLGLVEELRRNTDELTRMARNFALTSDPLFDQFYQDILAIRAGVRPRPADYDKVYWDLAILARRHGSRTEPAAALDQRIEAAGFSEAELAKLTEFERELVSLELLERVALNAVKGVFRDAGGQFTLRGAPNTEYAARLLHGPEHRQARARALEPLRALQVMVDQRTAAETTRLQAGAASWARIETYLLIALVLLVVVAFLTLHRRIIEPLLELTAAATGVGRNGFFRRVLVRWQDEFGVLAGSLNRMSELVEEKAAETAAIGERLRNVIEALPEAVVLTGADGRITQVNHATEALLGCAREELVGQTLAQWLTPPAGADQAVTAHHRDGTAIPVEVRPGPIAGPEDDQPLCRVIRDLRGQLASAAEREQLRWWHTTLLDSLPYPLFIQDAAARLVDCNAAFEACFGESRNSIKGRTVAEVEFLSEEAREKMDHLNREVIQDATRFSYEVPLTLPDGTARVMQCLVAGFRQADGVPGGLIGLLVDITDQQQAAEALRQSQALLQCLMDQVNAGIHVKDVEGRYRFINREYATWLERPAAEIIGRSGTDVLGRRAGAAQEEVDREIRQTRELREYEETITIRGEQRQFLTRKFPVVDDQGELLGTAGISTELTALKHAEARLTATHEELAATREETTALRAELLAAQAATEEALALAEAATRPESTSTDSVLTTTDEAQPAEPEPERGLSSPQQPPSPATAPLEPEVDPTDEPAAELDAPIEPAIESAIEPESDAEPEWTAVAPEGVIASPAEDVTSPFVDESSADIASPVESAATEMIADESQMTPGETLSGSANETETSEPGPAPTEPPPIDETAVPTSEQPVEPTPAPPRRARRKKEKSVLQPDLFGGSSDETEPVHVSIDPDGVPVVLGLDLRDTLNRLELPVESLGELVTRTAGEVTRLFGDLRTALAAGDGEMAQRQAHALAGVAGEVSADALRRLAKTLELAIKFDQGDTAAMLAELEREAARIVEGAGQLHALTGGVGRPAPARETVGTARRWQTALEELAMALEEAEVEAIGQAVAKLKSQHPPESARSDFEQLCECVDNTEYAEAAGIARRLIDRLA